MRTSPPFRAAAFRHVAADPPSNKSYTAAIRFESEQNKKEDLLGSSGFNLAVLPLELIVSTRCNWTLLGSSPYNVRAKSGRDRKFECARTATRPQQQPNICDPATAIKRLAP